MYYVLQNRAFLVSARLDASLLPHHPLAPTDHLYLLPDPLRSFFFFFLRIRRPPSSPLFPYPTLFRSRAGDLRRLQGLPPAGWFRRDVPADSERRAVPSLSRAHGASGPAGGRLRRGGRLADPDRRRLDRKSTRLNSSHLVISYAVFCLK